MKVLQKGTTPTWTPIQIEDWNENYSFMPYGSTLGCYPKSKASHDGAFAPKEDKVYRFSFDFKSEGEAKKAFDDLVSGTKVLSDFIENLSDKKYTNCILTKDELTVERKNVVKKLMELCAMYVPKFTEEDCEEIINLSIKKHNKPLHKVFDFWDDCGTFWTEKEIIDYVSEGHEKKITLEEILSWNTVFMLKSGILVSWEY